MKCLTPAWPKADQLWQHPIYGARTLANIDEMKVLAANKPKPTPSWQYVEESLAMGTWRENFIDLHSFSP